MLRLTIACALLLSAPVAAQQASNPGAAPQAPVKEKKICVSDMTTGSMMPKRVCHTKAEWDAINAENRKNVDFARDQRQNMPGGN